MFTEFMGLGPKVRRHVDDALPHARKIKKKDQPVERPSAPRRSVHKAADWFWAREADLGNCSVADRKPKPC